MTINEFLKARREQLGMTQYRAAKDAGLRPEALAKIEKGSDPRWSTLFRLCEVLKVKQLPMGKLVCSGE